MTGKSLTPRALTVRAFAKINLDLQVLGLRPDGYHELRTTFQAIALSDTLTFTKSRGPFRIECDDPAFPADRSNLIWKAAERVLRLAGTREAPSGMTVRVEKNIPMQSGLGGGSSNAAAALRALCVLWRVPASAAELHHAAAMIGADVPFFLEGGTALGFHRGDLLCPLDDIEPSWVVIVVPEFGVSTKEAFGWWDEDRQDRQGRQDRQDRQDGQDRRDGRDGQDGRDGRGRQDGKPRRAPRASAGGGTKSSNDLQHVVAQRHPIVSKLVRTLINEGAFQASLSGSGSAVFGLFRRRSDAQAAARKLAGPRTFVTPTLSRRACQRLAAK